MPERVRLRTGFSRALQGISASRFRMTGKKCHPEAAGRRIPAVERQAAGARAPTDEILQRFALQNDSSGVILSEAIPLRGTRGSRP